MHNHFQIPSVAAVVDDVNRLASCAAPRALCPCAWGLAAALAAPHFLYAFIWFRPHAWQRAFGRRSVDVFAACGAIGKGESVGERERGARESDRSTAGLLLHRSAAAAAVGAMWASPSVCRRQLCAISHAN